MKHRALLALSACLLAVAPAKAQSPAPAASSISFTRLAGLLERVEVARDKFGIAHIAAKNDHDLYFMQGYVHAQDRLFQMDVTRRQASGTLAELLGPDALAADVQLRTLGIRRAAVRSLAVVSDETRTALEAYAEGVNAYVAGAGKLPPEYQAIEISKFSPWSALDGMAVAKSLAFSLSFDLSDIDNTIALQTYSAIFDPALGAGTGLKLFSQDLWRSEPFTHASTIPDALAGAGAPPKQPKAWSGEIDPRTLGLAKSYGDRVRDMPFFKERMNHDRRPGSNEWAISGRNTVSGRPLVANDPHLALVNPSTLYPIHLKSESSDVMGSSFAGTPFIALGQTRDIAWGATVSPMDLTDIFLEQIVPDPQSPSRLSTLYKGVKEPIIAIPETYFVNQIGDGVQDNLVAPPAGATPPATFIVPRRNNGPIVQQNPDGTALSVQYTGFSGTRELDAFRLFNRAHNLEDFQRGRQFFDSATQNFAFADTEGTIAYFATSEMPLREDLQSEKVTGLPPWFIRNGAGGNEWLPVQHKQPGQAIPYEILPDNEMPHLVNPPVGWFVNANNDPDGTVLDNDPLNRLRPDGGLYYLNPGYDFGLRAGRITDLIEGKLKTGPLSFTDMQSIQADVTLPDAQFFAPLIVRALSRASGSQNPALQALAASPEIREAVGRIGAWKLTTPTGIPQGYDSADVDGRLSAPGSDEISESVAATIYSVWRGQLLRNTIDATLDAVPLPPGKTMPKPGAQLSMTAIKALMERPQPGVGASGINFFNAPAASAEDRRDIVILQSLADALTRLAGPNFALAFGGSTHQNDYRWGKLHRIVFQHPLGHSFNAPPAFGRFPNPLGDALPGFPTDGGFVSVDVANHDPRAQGANDFMFNAGPSNRFVATEERRGMRAELNWPGGTSADLTSQFYLNLLTRWLTNDTISLLFRPGELQPDIVSANVYAPGK